MSAISSKKTKLKLKSFYKHKSGREDGFKSNWMDFDESMKKRIFNHEVKAV